MKKIYILIIVCCFVLTKTNAQVKILFDATKAETAGNADWVIDADAHNLIYSSTTGLPYTTSATGKQSNAQQTPNPAQSGITSTTAENYWDGGISYWGIDCVKKGYAVETLPYNGAITYGNSSNAQDLSKYNIYVVVEPNILFTAAEKTAIVTFVKNGGSLFIVSDHTVSDRNNDGHDSPEIWNDLFTNNGVATNPFGISFDLANISGSSTNVISSATDSLIHGSFGNVSQVLWSNGTTMTIDKTVNPSVKAAVYKSGASNTGSTNVLVAYARYGLGKVVAFGDSSPFDDGTGDPNDQLYDGYITDANGNHQKLIMNATIWLATKNPLPVELSAFTVTQNKNNILLQWQTATEVNSNSFDVEQSYNSKDFTAVATVAAKGFATTYQYAKTITDADNKAGVIYYRLKMIDKDGSNKYSSIKTVSLTKNSISNTLYPNPARGFVRCNKEVLSAEVYNVLGKKILTQTINNNSIDITSLPKGIYAVRLIIANDQYSFEKLIVE